MKIKLNKLLFLFLILFLSNCIFLTKEHFLKKEIPLLETSESIQKKFKKVNNVQTSLICKITTPEKSINFKGKLYILPHFSKIRLDVIDLLGQIMVFAAMKQEKLSVYIPFNKVLIEKKLIDIFGKVNSKEIIDCFLGIPFFNNNLNNYKEKIVIEKNDFSPENRKDEKNKIHIFYSNFKNINDIPYPYFIKVYFPEKEITLEITYTKIKINNVIKKDLFEIDYPKDTIIVNDFN